MLNSPHFDIMPSRYIYVGGNGRISFFSNDWIICYCICTPYLLYPFIHWWTLGLLSYLLWIILECWNVGVQIILQDSDFISFVYIPQGEITGSYSDSIFTFWRISMLFSVMTESFYILLTVHKFLFFPHPHQHLLSCLLNDSHYGRCAVIFHCGFDLHFLIISDIETLFMYLLVICMFLWKNLFNFFDHFFKNWVIRFLFFSCMSSSHIYTY